MASGVFGWVMSAALGVGAQPRPTLTPEAVREADQAFQSGTAAFRRGDYQSAAESFRRANARLEHPDTLYNLGRALEELGELAMAIDAYARALDLAPRGWDARPATARLEALRNRPVELLLRSSPDGATVRVDTAAASLCSTPCPVRLAPGPHTLVVEHAGYRPAVERVTLRPGVNDERAVTLEALPSPPPGGEPPVVAPRPSVDRVALRRIASRVSGRLSLSGGVALPRDRPDVALGGELGVFIGRHFSAQFATLLIDATDTPRLFLGEVGWVFLFDELDLGVSLNAGALDACASCREGSLRTGEAQFVAGVTVRADVFLAPRLALGLFGRFSWRNAAVDDVDALLSSFGLSVSFHL
ncbi:MAG: PEGA domain-containing protein [Myxococcales bacterium]|nr:PEGA domain-containing protein [Myxococcales bacterium]